MPANLSSNKVRVTKFYGTPASQGLMDPKIGMKTQFGKILTIASGAFTVDVGVGSGSAHQRFYPHQLQVTLAEATGHWSWPTGDGSVYFGHDHGMNAGGSPLAAGTGSSYLSGDGKVYTFGRA